MNIRCYLWVGLPFLSFFFFFHCRNCFLWISFWHSQIPIQKSIQFQKTLFNWITKSNETELMFYTQQSNHQVHIVKVFILFIANCAVKNFIISIVQNCECVCVPIGNTEHWTKITQSFFPNQNFVIQYTPTLKFVATTHMCEIQSKCQFGDDCMRKENCE